MPVKTIVVCTECETEQSKGEHFTTCFCCGLGHVDRNHKEECCMGCMECLKCHEWTHFRQPIEVWCDKCNMCIKCCTCKGNHE